jgi:hypothetical protein
LFVVWLFGVGNFWRCIQRYSERTQQNGCDQRYGNS